MAREVFHRQTLRTVINRNESAPVNLARYQKTDPSDRGGRKLLHTSAGDVSRAGVLLLIKRLTDRHQTGTPNSLAALLRY